jgi:hypothetical protein
MSSSLRLLVGFIAFFFGALSRSLFGGLGAHNPHHPYHGSPPPSSGGSASNVAIGALVCGIASWTIAPFVCAIIAIVLGRGEIKKIDQGLSPSAGRTFAVIGMWLGIINVALTVVGGCVGVAVFVLFFGGLAGLAAVAG